MIVYTVVLLAALCMQSIDWDMPQSEIPRPPWTSRLSSRLSRRLWHPEALHQSVCVDSLHRGSMKDRLHNGTVGGSILAHYTCPTPV